MTSNNLDFTARCLAASVKKAISDQLGDTSIKIISKEEYDSIEHDANTIYYVRDGDKIIQYIGDAKIGTGSISGLSSLYGVADNSINGDAEHNEI